MEALSQSAVCTLYNYLIVQEEYDNGEKWNFRIYEISELNRRYCYELIDSENKTELNFVI